MNFKKIELSDQAWIDELLKESNFNSSEYCFSNMMNWRDIYNTEIARLGDYAVVRSGFKEFSYMYPFGRGDVHPVIDAMCQDAKDNNVDLNICGVLEPSCAELEMIFPGKFCFREERDYFDYIYSSQVLAELKGKKLHGKRNHINNFKLNNPDWSFEPITRENIASCLLMNEEWCAQNDCTLGSSLEKERCSVHNAFEYFFEEGLRGGLLKAGGKVIAYTMGRPLNSDTFIVHIEKAFSAIQGCYPMINQQFVSNCCMDFPHINREDDTGEEGLRKAKLSYYPEILLPKFSISLAEEIL